MRYVIVRLSIDDELGEVFETGVVVFFIVLELIL